MRVSNRIFPPSPFRVLAVRDHLVRDLGKEVGHALRRVVVAGDGVDHLDGVHQRRQRVDDRRLGTTQTHPSPSNRIRQLELGSIKCNHLSSTHRTELIHCEFNLSNI